MVIMSEVKKQGLAETIRPKKSNLEENAVELNLDCLLEIFEYLPILDRIRVDRVNKKWYEASCLSLGSLKTWKIEVYDDRDISFIELKTNFRIEVNYKSKAFEELLLRFGKFVLEVLFWEIEDVDPVLVILNKCRNIKKARFEDMYIEAVKPQLFTLEKLTDLTFFMIDDIRQDRLLLETILSKLKLRLTSFHINGGKLTKRFFKSFSPNIECLRIENCELTNMSCALNILGNFKHLRSLTLCRLWSNYANFEHFIDLVKKLNLKKLNISRNREWVNDDFLIELAKHADTLTGLNISGSDVTDKGLNAVTNLPNLEILIIEALKEIRGNVDVNLPNLKFFWCENSNLSEKTLLKFLNTSDKIEYLAVDKISKKFITSAVKITQARKSKIPLKISINTKDEKILEIVNKTRNKIPKEHTRKLKIIISDLFPYEDDSPLNF